MQLTPIKKTFTYGAHQVTLETGEMARQAHGAVVVNMDDSVVLCTVVGARATTSRKPTPPARFPEAFSSAKAGLRKRRR